MGIIRVLIVDDHPMVRRGLRSLLSSYQDLEVVGEAEDGRTALRAVVDLSPDVILLDIQLRGPNGIEVAYQLRREAPQAKIVVLTAYEEYVLPASRAGIHAYLLKTSSDETVVEAIRLAHQGKRLLSPSLLDEVLRQFQVLAKAQARDDAGLSEEELKVLELMGQGRSNREISQETYCSERTVKRRIHRIMDKLGVRNRAHAVAEAIKMGLI